MFDVWISLILISLIGFSAWGWGVVILKPAQPDPRMAVAYPITVGVAGWCFVGGLLNLFHLAGRPALIALLFVGVGAGLLECARSLRQEAQGTSTTNVKRLLPVAGFFFLLLVLTVFQMPAAVMNVGDDFETYLIRPVRLLDTGSLAGDNFDGLGSDSLGAHFFLQGFIFAFLPLPYISGLDHVFCLFAGVLLIRELGKRLEVSGAWTWLAGLLFLLVHPQTVNVSSVYSTTLIALGLAAAVLPTEPVADGRAKIFREWIIPGLLLGALASLKTIAAFYGAFFGITLMLLRYREKTGISAWLKSHGLIAVTALMAALPWFVALADRFQRLFAGVTPKSGYIPPEGLVEQDFSSLLGFQDLYYGGNLLGYNLIVLSLALFVGWQLTRARSAANGWLPAVTVAAAAIATFVLNNCLFNYQTAIRYSVPLFLTGLPLAMLVCGAGRASTNRWITGTTLALALAIGALFVLPAFARARQFASWQTYLPYAVSESNARHNAEVFDPRTADFFRSLQESIPPGQPVLTWMKQPFLLDYGRNTIRVGNTHGLMAPWVQPPLSGEAEDMRRFLQANEVAYVLLEREAVPAAEDHANLLLLRSGNPVYHRMATYDIAIETGLNQLALVAETVAERERFIIYRVAPPAP